MPFLRGTRYTLLGNNKGFLPSDLPGLKLWTRHNQGITVTGSGVSQWDDQSGNGNHLKQATDANRPSKESDGSILCDGVDEYLVSDAFTELTQGNTIYALFRQVTWADADNIYDGISATKRNALFQLTSTPNLAAYAGTSLSSNPDLALNAYGVIASVYNGASSRIQTNDSSAVTGNANTQGLTGITLGAKYDASQFANAQYKEFIVFNTVHDAAIRTKVIAYLARVGSLSL